MATERSTNNKFVSVNQEHDRMERSESSGEGLDKEPSQGYCLGWILMTVSKFIKSEVRFLMMFYVSYFALIVT